MAYPNRKRTPRQRQLKNIVEKGRYQRRFGSKALFYWYIKITSKFVTFIFVEFSTIAIDRSRMIVD